MANLIEADNWPEGVYQIEEDDPVLGGATGITNVPPRQLAERTRYLRAHGIAPWSSTFSYPALSAYVSHAGATWKSVGASLGVEPGVDPAKWERWGHTGPELNAAAVGRLLNVRLFDAPGTHMYNKSPGTTRVLVEVQGAGGSGGSCPGISDPARIGLSGAGGGGAYAKGLFTENFDGVVVTVGAGGPQSAVGANAGVLGGTSSFGALVSAPGGTAGSAGASLSTPIVSGGGLNTVAPFGANILSIAGKAGGFSFAANGSNGFASNGGNGHLGMGGQTAPGAVGQPGVGFGGGGSGVLVPGNFTIGLAGGAGRGGVVVVWEYA